jgi:hypothetical protein
MKKLLIFLYSILCFLYSTSSIPLWGQGGSDSVCITHTQETGTLEKQRFIDQYDYVFMTKEPTKWMLKGYNNLSSTNDLNNNIFTWGRAAIEHKLTPSFSVQIAGVFSSNPYLPVYNPGISAFGGSFISTSGLSFTGAAEVRWYYNMAKRIKEGKANNNFSGNYLSIQYEYQLPNRSLQINSNNPLYTQNNQYITTYLYSTMRSRQQISYGVQRRFLSYGLIDFKINLNFQTRNIIQQQIQFPNNDNIVKPNQDIPWTLLSSSYQSFDNQDYFYIDTQLDWGIALADFKRKKSIPMCDIFRCYEEQHNMIKIGWPRLQLSTKKQFVGGFVGYEQKLWRSPISINTNLSYALDNSPEKETLFYNTGTKTYEKGRSQYFNLNYQVLAQLRCYLFLNKQIKKGKSANNLSGLYGSLVWGWEGFETSYKATFLPAQNAQASFSQFGLSRMGIMAGFQKKIFKNGFLDVSYTLSERLKESIIPLLSSGGFSLQLGFAL